MKKLLELKNEKIEKMQEITNKAEEEKRVLTEEETTEIENLQKDIKEIENSIRLKEEVRALSFKDSEPEKVEGDNKEKEEKSQDEINDKEIREILLEKRDEMNTKVDSQGGYVVNKYLSHDIIKEIKDRSDVYSFFNSTNIKGDLRIPKKASSGTAKWIPEGTTDGLYKAGDITIPTLEMIELKQHRLYRESAITKHMINTMELDLVGFIKDDVVDTMTDAIEEAIFLGKGSDSDEPEGILNHIKEDNKVKVTSKDAITVEQLKMCRAKIKKSEVDKAKWFMNPEVYLLVDLLQDANGRPLLQPDITTGTGYRLLGLPVTVTDAMPGLGGNEGDVLVLIACPSAYHTNTQQNLAMHVYNDSSYTRVGLVGYAADIFMDGKVKNDQLAAAITNNATMRTTRAKVEKE